MNDDANPRDVGADAMLAATLVAVSPTALGGLVVRGSPGELRDAICARLRDQMANGAPFPRVPLHITEDRLLGGLSLAATLRRGRVVVEEGLLARADSGVVVLSMAERIEAVVTAHVCEAVDRGELSLEREGITARVPCRIGVIALDEGIDDERAPEPLRDRLAFEVDLRGLELRVPIEGAPDPGRTEAARTLLPGVTIDDELIAALCETASALGISSLRGPLLAAAAARVHAALEGRSRVVEEDAVVAARLVLGPRATRLPCSTEEEESDGDGESGAAQEPPGADAAPARARAHEPSDGIADGNPPAGNEEILLEAAKSGIPAGLLDAISHGRERRAALRSGANAGALCASTAGGRPAGIRPGAPRSGERLNVVETLRAAAPWQRLRRRASVEPASAPRRGIEVRKDDLRITRFQQRTETSVIFSVNASGSAALQRLAEAKGAVEQVLADCYARRDHVALIAFRGTSATLLLPPTRSLARVRRSLADLAGGGTTPLAAGIDAALSLALDARKRGRTPVVVLMTDGRANVARDGRQGGAIAAADAISSARNLRALRVQTLFLDTAPRPRQEARVLSGELGARYLPLPYVDALGISGHVRSLAAAGAP